MRQSPGFLLLLLIFVAATAAGVFLLAGPNPWLALGVPLALPFMALLAKHPEWGFYLIIALVPLDSWRTMSEEYQFLTISKFISIWIIFVVGMRIALDPVQVNRLRSRIWWPLGAYFFINVLATIYCMEGQWVLCLDHMRNLVTAYSIVGLTLYFIQDRQFRRVVPLLVIFSTTFASLVALAGRAFHIEGLVMMATTVEGGRLIGAASDPNFFAATVLCALPLLALLVLTTDSKHLRFGYGALFVINTAAIVLTYSRGVLLIFTIVMALLALEHGRRMRVRYLGFAILFFSIVLGYAVYKIPQTSLWERMKTVAHPFTDPSLEARGSYLIVAKDVVMRHPVLGTGPGTFPVHYSRTNYAAAFAREHTPAAYRRAAHNTYMEIAVGTGFVGSLAYAILLLTCFWFFFKGQSILQASLPFLAGEMRALAICFVAILASFMFLSGMYHKYIWLFVGLAAVAKRIAEHREQERA